MIVVDHLSKYYGPLAALQEISFRVEVGEILGLLGPPGAGKTTTLRILTGGISASGGCVTVAGYDIGTHPLEVRKRIGYLPENATIYPEMTVRNYLDFIAEVKGLDYYTRLKHVSTLMESCGLHTMEHRRIQSLPQSDRLRVGLVQALLNHPPVLLFDMPSLGLDPTQAADIHNIIMRLRHKHAMVLSTHSLLEANALCNHVALLNAGRILAMDTPAHLLTRAHQQQRLSLEVRGPAEAVHTLLADFTGVDSVEQEPAAPGEPLRYTLTITGAKDLRAAIAHAIVLRGWLLQELRPLRSTLDDVLAQLVTEAD